MKTTLKPQASPQLSECQLDDELGLYDSRNNAVHLLNSTAAAIWWMCDGKHTLGEISSQIANAYNVNVQNIAEDIREIIENFRDAGLITL